MDVIQYAWKGKMMDALERFHIYDITQKGVQINDKLTVQHNPIFDILDTFNIEGPADAYTQHGTPHPTLHVYQ